jgi:hypothetical protein
VGFATQNPAPETAEANWQWLKALTFIYSELSGVEILLKRSLAKPTKQVKIRAMTHGTIFYSENCGVTRECYEHVLVSNRVEHFVMLCNEDTLNKKCRVKH